jgi:hypothetical protein
LNYSPQLKFFEDIYNLQEIAWSTNWQYQPNVSPVYPTKSKRQDILNELVNPKLKKKKKKIVSINC